ncbi:MAG: hypothetical protein FI692_07835, partial [SAR202 cluster bacterium]|nr:hypothetical protein [SAR202 cluster bacterium]
AYIRKHASTGEIHFDSQGGVRVNLDTNANNTDKTFSIGANASTSDVFSVSETGQVTIAGGGPGADKVLTSDANGLATWEDAAGGGGFGTSYAINSFFGKNRN